MAFNFPGKWLRPYDGGSKWHRRGIVVIGADARHPIFLKLSGTGRRSISADRIRTIRSAGGRIGLLVQTHGNPRRYSTSIYGISAHHSFDAIGVCAWHSTSSSSNVTARSFTSADRIRTTRCVDTCSGECDLLVGTRRSFSAHTRRGSNLSARCSDTATTAEGENPRTNHVRGSLF